MLAADQTRRCPAEVVRLQYLASAIGDMELWREVVAPDVEWTEAAGFPLAGTYRTPQGAITGVFERRAAECDEGDSAADTDGGCRSAEGCPQHIVRQGEVR